MIDSKDLDKMLALIELHPSGTHAVMADKNHESYGSWLFNGETLHELIRLARLGLYAEQALADHKKSMEEK